MSDWSEFITKQAGSDEAAATSYIPVVDDVLVELAGDDAAKLLQGQVTADIDKLATGEFVLSALCTNKGRVISTFTLYHAEDAFYCRLPRDNAGQLVQTLKKYAVFYKVEISIRADVGILVLVGTKLPEGFPDPLASLHLEDGLVECWITEPQWSAALESLTDCTRSLESRWQLKKIGFGWPDIHENTTEAFLPHALSLDLAEAISFTKGCYTGQEIVARTHYRGKSKKRLLHLQLNGSAPAPGTELHSPEGKNIGSVVVAENSEQDKSELLATANIDTPEHGELKIGDQLIQYRTLPLAWQT